MTCQRWRERRDSYRPAGEPIEAARYGVELIDRDRDAAAFVSRHHYSGTLPAARPGASWWVETATREFFSISCAAAC